MGDRTSSPAKPGRCTKTGGYLSNAEIEEIVQQGGAIKRWSDDTITDSDYMVYEGTEWIAYMSEERKASRAEKYKGWNFGGTSDWAVDLQRVCEHAVDAPSWLILCFLFSRRSLLTRTLNRCSRWKKSPMASRT